MADISTIADEFRRDLIAREARAFAEMERAWLTVEQRINDELRLIEQAIRRARNRGIPPDALLARERRLERLAVLTGEQVRRFADTTQPIAAAHAEAAATVAGGQARRMIEWGTPDGIGVDAIRLPTDAVEQIVARTATPQFQALFTNVAATGRDLADRMADELRAGLAVGENPRRVARRMRDVATLTDGTRPLPLHRAEMIARTEAMQAYREASRAVYAANSNLLRGWTWIAALDRRTCGSCIAQHGTEHRAEDTMDSHPSCFPAGVVVSGPRPDAATRRWWEGDLVELETAGGRRLAVTPNHPMLTPTGWVPAQFLNEGDYLVGGRRGERVRAAIHPDDHQAPSLIEDVALSLRRTGSMTTMPVPAAAMDFHGDGFDSQVDVVGADGFLRRGHEPAFAQPILKNGLAWGDVRSTGFTSPGDLASVLEGVLHAPGSGVSGAHVAPVLIGRSHGDHELVGALPPASLHTDVIEGPRDRYAGDPISVRELLLALAGEVEADQLIHIRRRPFAGHVYNLQTSESWYSVNGILTHNCRCVAAPSVRSWRELGFNAAREPDPVEPGGRWLMRQPRRTQVAVLGRGKADALRSRQIAVEDLVAERHSPQWGRSTSEASLAVARRNAARRRALSEAA